jgi:tRNA (guanine-N7-)-methyltransferase
MTDTTRPIRTFHPRRGRMSTRHADAFTGMWPAFGLTVVDGDRSPLDLEELFGRAAPKVLEIGFGMGDATAAMAAAEPGRDYLAAEVHTPGIGNLLALVGELGLTNVRVAHGDALELVQRLAPASLDAVHIFFPDPWPKARHHKRRLIQPGNVRLLRRVVRPGGVLHCATDWPDYATTMADVLEADPGLVRGETTDPGLVRGETTDPGLVRGESAAPGPVRDEDTASRPVTKFERRGAAAGRPIVDLVYRRR